MKKSRLIGAWFMLMVVVKAEPGFLPTLPADDFTGSGLQKLTPDELRRLEALVQRYRTGELTEARQQAEAKSAAAQQEAEQKIAAAENEAREAKAHARETALKAKAAPAAPPKKQPGWFAALLTLDRASEKPEKEEPLESRLVGNFAGWNGNSIFRLENGSSWMQQNKTESYAYSPLLHSPKVRIRPAAIRGFWLEIDGVNLQVRVIPGELSGQK